VINTLKIFTSEVVDTVIRDNFTSIRNFFDKNSQFIGFSLLEFEVNSAVTNEKIPHSLGFQPKDLVQTSKIGSGTITYNYDKFDSTNLDITTTGPCKIRAYVGTHKEGIQ